jgi:acyl-coenzyme A thioesterase PaaI-like protein
MPTPFTRRIRCSICPRPSTPSRPLLPGLPGVRLPEAAPSRVLAELTVHPDLCTVGGILHGGAGMAFCDTLGALGTVLNLRPGQTTTTVDSSTKFIRGPDRRLCAVVTQTQRLLDATAGPPPAL